METHILVESPIRNTPRVEQVRRTQEASNVTKQEEAQSEFAKSLDEKFHTHNYWGGALEKLLMDADVASAPLVYQNPNNPFDTAFT